MITEHMAGHLNCLNYPKEEHVRDCSKMCIRLGGSQNTVLFSEIKGQIDSIFVMHLIFLFRGPPRCAFKMQSKVLFLSRIHIFRPECAQVFSFREKGG